MKKIKVFQLIEVDSFERVDFTSALEKQFFLQTHKEGTYRILNDFAEVYLYFVIDTSERGFVLNNLALPYEQCLELIKHYK